MIEAWLIGDDELRARLNAMPVKVREGIGRAVLAIAVELEGRVKREKLSDMVLKVKSNTLRGNITHKVEETGDGITGIVGTNVAYAHYQEYGFKGTESVKEHLRTITRAFGREIKGGSRSFMVRAHTRKVDYPAHSFLRSALADMKFEIKGTLAKAVIDAVKS